MADSVKPGETDILALIAQIHGGSPEQKREDHVNRAISALEATHRQAAQAMQELKTQGLKKNRHPAPAGPASKALPAAAAQQPVAPQNKGEAPGSEARKSSLEPEAVQSGRGADVDIEPRSLTHIIRPNRGRR